MSTAFANATGQRCAYTIATFHDCNIQGLHLFFDTTHVLLHRHYILPHSRPVMLHMRPFLLQQHHVLLHKHCILLRKHNILLHAQPPDHLLRTRAEIT